MQPIFEGVIVTGEVVGQQGLPRGQPYGLPSALACWFQYSGTF
jgi:hypothetical protein